MRKLASIQIIKQLDPIPKADRIERATVLGWQLVVRKGEFTEGDLCVYCEVDSILPDWPEFEFLGEKKRIRTIKMRGQISQGIAFPVPLLEQYISGVEVGDDVTDLLKILKYEPPVRIGKFPAKGSFPYFIPKTDETRIQSVPEFLVRHEGEYVYITEKLDGTSATYFVKDGEFGFCSRNLELKRGYDSAYEKMVEKYNLEEKLLNLGKDIAIQGELVGPKIQKNKYGLNGQEFFVFDIYDITNQRYYGFKKLQETLQVLNLAQVPVLSSETFLSTTVEELVDYSIEKSDVNPKVYREGIVFRTLEEKTDPETGRASFKVINTKFLLKYKDEWMNDEWEK